MTGLVGSSEFICVVTFETSELGRPDQAFACENFAMRYGLPFAYGSRARPSLHRKILAKDRFSS